MLAAEMNQQPYWDGVVLCVGKDEGEYAPAVPVAVTARQARLALLAAGKLALVENALASIPGPQGDAARIEWEYALEIRRDSLVIGALAPMLGLTDAQVDDLFRAAEVL